MTTLRTLALAATLAAAPLAHAQQGPIRIGLLPPITGPLASPGAEMVNGFRLFWEQAGTPPAAARSRSSPPTPPAIRTRR